jgi:hypothetical protein
LRYGLALTYIASAKLAFQKKDLKLFKDYIKGFHLAKKEKQPYLVSEDEGRFIRKLQVEKDNLRNYFNFLISLILIFFKHYMCKGLPVAAFGFEIPSSAEMVGAISMISARSRELPCGIPFPKNSMGA